MKHITSITAFTALLGLSLTACDRAPRDAEVKADIAESSEPDAQATASIFTPEAGIKAEVAPLEPLVQTVGFPLGGSDIDTSAVSVLDAILASPQMQRGRAIILRGHSDSDGTDAANMRASQNRAEAVRDWLVKRGVAPERIQIVAFGEQNPAVPNARPDGQPDEEGRARNRRVEVTVTLGNGAPQPAEAASGSSASK